MSQPQSKIIVKWEYVVTPDAEERLAAAFAMLLDVHPKNTQP